MASGRTVSCKSRDLLTRIEGQPANTGIKKRSIRREILLPPCITSRVDT